MKTGVKIVTIGGGSSYTPELVEGFIKRYDELPLAELWLVDIDEGRQKLEIVGALAQRMFEAANLPTTVHLTLNRRDALKDADFVTTQFRVGFMQARITDEKIPLKYGVIGQETNGPGGMMKGLRTIPVILDIVADIKELCPNAWLINFTNPAGMVTEAVHAYTDFKQMIGVCNVPIGVKSGIADIMEVDEKRLEIDFAGLNHMVYGLRAYIDGKEQTASVIEKMVVSDKNTSMRNIADIDWEPDFIRALGVIPCPYHRYYYKTDEMLAHCQEEAKTVGTRGEQVAKLEELLFEAYRKTELTIKPKELEERGGARYSDAACGLISSIYNNKKDIQTVNTCNVGAIANLPYQCAVELNCIIGSEGPKPIAVGNLPSAVSGLVNQIKSFEQAVVKSAITGDYKTALMAMTINPLVPGDRVAKQLLDEMLEVNRKYLPRFFS